MRRSPHILFKILLLLGLAVVAVFVWLGFQMPDKARRGYAHWAAMDLIATAHEKSGRLPGSWADLTPWYDDSWVGPRNHVSLQEMRSRVEIDFQNLAALAAAPEQQPLPKVIHFKDKSGVRWIKAEEELAAALSRKDPESRPWR